MRVVYLSSKVLCWTFPYQIPNISSLDKTYAIFGRRGTFRVPVDLSPLKPLKTATLFLVRRLRHLHITPLGTFIKSTRAAMAEETTGTVTFNAGLRSFKTWYRVFGDLKNSNRRPVVIMHDGPGSTHHYLL
jgi:hypothetical protein